MNDEPPAPGGNGPEPADGASLLGRAKRVNQEARKIREQFADTATNASETWKRLMRTRNQARLDHSATLNLLEDTELARRGRQEEAAKRERAEEESRVSAERYRRLFKSIDEACCVLEVLFNGEGKPWDCLFLEANPAFARQTGVTDAVGRRLRELALAHDEVWFEAYGRVVRTGEPVRFEHQDGRSGRAFDVRASRIGGEAERKIAVFFNDITERKRGEESLARSLRETEAARAAAEAAAQAKDHFLAVLSHELRTPLTPVLLAAGMIESTCGQDPVIREMLEMIRRNVGIEARLIKDLLDVTRIGHGKFEITPAPLDLHQVIGRALVIIEPDCEEKEQRLMVALEAAHTMVSGDDTRLEQVVCNLLKNASKFTPEEGRIEVRTSNEEDQIVVEVTDSGIGIDASEQALIFDAFAQANQSITQKFGGLGLGLAIAKAIVDGHGGELRVQSEGRDQGATFRIRMPLLSQDQAHPSP